MNQVTAPARPTAGAKPAHPEQPFKGLAAYEEKDSLLFFGRERDRKIVAANLRSSRLTLLYGPSGVGKSSLLRAGVLKDLHESAQAEVRAGELPRYIPVLLEDWSEDPVARLAERIREAVDQVRDGDGARLLPADAGLSETLEAWEKLGHGVLLVILDQFEEYFVSHPDEDGEGTFAVEFPRAVNRRELPVHFLVSIREDALARLDRFKGRIPTLFSNRLQIEHLTRAAAREAIRKPVAVFSRGRVGIEDELVETVLDQVSVGQVRLEAKSAGAGEAAADRDSVQRRIEATYLQLVMEKVWLAEQAEGSSKLRLSTFVDPDRLGGAKQIARDYFNTAMSGFTRDQRDLSAQAFRFLVTSSGAKIVWSTDDLANVVGSSREELEPVLHQLAEDRILRPVDALPESPNDPRYEIFHDVLAPEILDWRTDWERHLAERKRRKLVGAIVVLTVLLASMGALAWWAFDQKEAADKQEQRAESQRLAATSLTRLAIDPTDAIKLALQAVTATEDPEPLAVHALRQSLSLSREQLRLRGYAGWVTGAEFSRPDGRLVLTSSLDGSVRVWNARTGAKVRTLGGFDGGFVPAAFSPRGERVLMVTKSNTARILDAETGDELAVLEGHTETLTSAEFSRDGRFVLTAAGDGRARVWDTETKRKPMVLRHGDWVNSAHFGGTDKLVVTAGNDRTVRVWAVRTGRQVDEFRHPKGDYNRNPVWSAVFDQDGKRVATASKDGAVRIWTVGAEAKPIVLLGHTPSADGVEFSHDGDLLLSWGGKEARIWNLSGQKAGERVLSHRDWVEAAGFSDDGKLVATSSDDGAISVWEAASGKRLFQLHGHRDASFSVDFDPTGQTLLTASADKTARTWDLGSGESEDILRGHDGWVNASAFSSDGKIVTAGSDGVARVWVEDEGPWRNLPLEEGYHSGALSDVAFSPNGELIVTTGSEDWSAYVWKASGEFVGSLADPWNQEWVHEGGVTSGAFDPQGQLIVTAGYDNIARVWRTPTESEPISGTPVAVLEGHHDRVTEAAFSSDGKRIVTASLDGTARVWEWETWRDGAGKSPVTIDANTLVFGVAFVPGDGDRVVTAGGNGEARMWDAATGENTGQVFAGHVGRLASVAFDSDGKRLVTAGTDLTTRVWDVESGRQLSIMQRHADLVNTAVFSPDDGFILSASDDGTARIYPCETCGSLEELIQEARERLRATQG